MVLVVVQRRKEKAHSLVVAAEKNTLFFLLLVLRRGTTLGFLFVLFSLAGPLQSRVCKRMKTTSMKVEDKEMK